MTPPIPVRPAAPAFRLLVLAAVAVLATGGCGGPASPAPAPAAPPPTAEGCGDVADRVRRQVARFPVRSVTVEGQCTTVVVTAADGDPAAATQLCEAAAEVAYSGDVNSVRVLGPSGDELANGIAGAGCLTG